MDIITLNEAKRLGLKRYFTGKPCPRGHVAERSVAERDCVECVKLRMAKYRAEHQPEAAKWRAEHRETAKAYNQTYYAENAAALREYASNYRLENAYAVRERDKQRQKTEKRKQQNKQSRERNKAKILSREAERYLRESERIKARVAQYRKDNPEKVRLINRICGAAIRAIRKQAPGKFGKPDVIRLMVLQQGKCAVPDCDNSIPPFHIDHILAVTRGGTNWPDNLQLTCGPCNLSKGTKTMEEWTAWKLRLI